MWSTTLYDHPLPALQWGAVLGASLVGAVLDARSHRIPNVLTGPVLLAGLAVGVWVGGAAGLADAAVAAVIMALPFVVLFVVAGGGAGDAKLMGALGAWLGVAWGTVALFAVCVCGIVLAVLHAAAKKRLATVLRNLSGTAIGMLHPLVSGEGSVRAATRLLPAQDEGQQMPYGPAIFAGILLTAGGSLFWRGW